MSEARSATSSRQSEYQGGGAAGGDNRVGLVGMHDGDGEGAAHGPSAARVASGKDSPVAMCCSMRCAITSVSVAEVIVCPARTNSIRRALWFSMIPLWMMARRPVQSRWGWAFSDVGWPWVAQRVWPMPAPCPAGGGRVAGVSPSPQVSLARSATERVPSAARARQMPPSATSATPAES